MNERKSYREGLSAYSFNTTRICSVVSLHIHKTQSQNSHKNRIRKNPVVSTVVVYDVYKQTCQLMPGRWVCIQQLLSTAVTRANTTRRSSLSLQKWKRQSDSDLINVINTLRLKTDSTFWRLTRYFCSVSLAVLCLNVRIFRLHVCIVENFNKCLL